MIIKSAITKMAPPKLKLYVDTVSPFAYEAYYILRVRLCLVDSNAGCGEGLEVGLWTRTGCRLELRAHMLMRRRIE